ncbi:MAG: helix-turn-helix domain-containing protein, partial [Isosphaeraceae bacterium]
MTVEQLAELLDVSTRHLHRMRSRGTIIEPIKLGRMTR